MTTAHPHHLSRVQGPWLWVVSLIVGVLIGAAATKFLIPEYIGTASDAPAGVPAEHATEAGHGSAPAHRAPGRIPLVLCVPFVLLLASIALAPFISQHWWHHHFPDVSFLLGGIVAGYYIVGFAIPGYDHGMTYGQYSLLHAVVEYYSFIALVGGLFVVSGTILVGLRGRATPGFNTALLLCGALLANVVGTTGASMLLIRPFIRANEGRLRAIHVVMFIFIVSNCGGALTPIGDPPLYLGYLKGVPFGWTLSNLVGEWAFVVGTLLAIYYVIDLLSERKNESVTLRSPEPIRVSIRGTFGVACLCLMVMGVFIDPWLKSAAGIEGYPIGATFQLVVAGAAYAAAPRQILASNSFSFFPVKEVGLLFFGIFLTMVPALGYLSANGATLGIDTPTAFYFATGGLSGVLDNAPTYLNFMQIAFGDGEINHSTVRAWLETREHVLDLRAISTGAVFFGAMTYIGNGPNFMVRSIAEASLVRMPSFFGYLWLALTILLPVLIANWFLFFVVLR